MILRRHISGVVASRILSAMAAFVGVLQVLDMLDVTNDIMERHLGIGGVLYYALLRTPVLVEQVAPLSVLVGCLFAFLKLAREDTIVILSSAGVSVYRLVAMALPAAVAIAALHFATIQWISPKAEQTLTTWWAKSAPPNTDEERKLKSMRVGNDVLIASMDDETGTKLSNFGLYRRDASGNLIQRTFAKTAAFGPNGWRLDKPDFEMIGKGNVQRGSASELIWAEGPLPQDVRSIFSGSQSITPGTARRALEGGAAVQPPAYYRFELLRGWAAPATALVMLLLASPVMFVHARSGGVPILLLCLGAGLSFLVINGILAALGQSGNLPPLLAAWAASGIFGCLALTALVYTEG
ncbi:MAG: LptF/LptG family permease [Caulobacterales bacterium]